MEVIISPNDWMRKAGATAKDGKLFLPCDFLLVPMAMASEAILEFKKSKDLASRIKHGLVVVSMVRTADTAYFEALAKMLNKANPNKPSVCQHCLRGQLFGDNMKSYRKLANENIIHKMEKAIMIGPPDLDIVEKYYEEIFMLPLINPIKWGEKKGLKLCDECKVKWARYSKEPVGLK